MKKSRYDKVVVFDRDGTLVIDRGYMTDPADLNFFPETPAALGLFREHGFRSVVITNQSAIGRGWLSAGAMDAMNDRLTAMMRAEGFPLKGIYWCPHRPDDHCPCRKPQLNLLHRAAADIGFDPSRAYVIGDKWSDIEMGRRAGSKTVLIAAKGAHEQIEQTSPSLIARSLLEAAHWVVGDSDRV
jgi:histidinol-phosphate phosphatase family protein